MPNEPTSTACPLTLTSAEVRAVRGIVEQVIPGARVCVFGSRATGWARPFSDLDLLVVEPAHLSWQQRAELRERFEASDLPFRVDIVEADGLPSGMADRVASECVPLRTLSSAARARHHAPPQPVDNRPMEATLFEKQSEIGAVCRQFGVSRLEVFGSASVGGFDAASSDYDFIARFQAQPGISMGRRFMGLSDALEALLERHVDLMTDHPIENPYLRAAVNGSRKTIYAESPSETLI